MQPNSSITDIREAKQLEEMKYMEWAAECGKRRRQAIQASVRELSARGLYLSGARFQKELEINFDESKKLYENVIQLRQQLGAKLPLLFDQPQMEELRRKLEHSVDTLVTACGSGPTHQQLRGAAADTFRKLAEQKGASLKAWIRNRIAALPLETKLGVAAEQRVSVTNFNFTNNTIAALNLGRVIGDLNGTIQQLNEGGQRDVADALERLTTAIGATEELTDPAKKELLEHLAVLSEEAAKEPEKRKMGPVRTSIEAAKSFALGVTSLVSLWHALEQALRAHGIMPK